MSKFSMKVATSVAILGGIVASAVSASAALTLPTQSCSYVFNTNMKSGSRGTDVMNLQKVLNGWAQTRVAASGAGSSGMETTTFGAGTRAAVNKFQALHLTELGITAPTGNVFAGTRALLNEACAGTATAPVTSTFPLGCISASGFSSVTGASCAGTAPAPVTTTFPLGCTSASGFSSVTGASCAGTATTPVVTVSGPVSAALGSNQPSGTIVASQASAKLADFTLTGNGTVSAMEFQRIGVSSDDTLVNVYLYDGNTRISDAASVITGGFIRFSSSNGILTVNGSRTISVRADIKSGISGQTVGVKLNSLTVAGGSPSTFTSLLGNQLQIANVTNLATANVSYYSPVTTRTVDAGTTNLSVWSRQVNVGNHSANLKAATLRYIGSASTDAVANLSLYVDSVKVAGPSTVNAANDNKITFDLAATPYVLLTGNHTVELRGDIVKGSSRTITYAIENAGDLMIEDAQLTGVNVTPTVDTASQSAQPFSRLTYDTFNVNQGSITVNTDPAFIVNNVTGGAANMTIGQFTFKAYGEDVKVNSLAVRPILTGGASYNGGTMSNMSLYVNGGQVGTSQNATNNTDNTYNLGSSLIVPAGTTVTVAVKGDLRTTTGTNYATGTVSVQLTVGSSNGQGQNSYTIANIPQASLSGAALTVTSGAGSFSRTSGFTATQVVSPNTTGVKLGSFTVQAGSAEGLVITGATLAVSTTGSFQNLSNMTVKDGSSVLSTPIGQVNSSNSVNFNSISVAANGVKTFDIYADLGNATSSSTFTVGMTLNYRGAISNTIGSGTNAGTVSTANTAVLASSTLVSSSPSAQFVVGGNTQTIGTFRLGTLSSGTIANVRQINLHVQGADAIESVTIAGVTAPVVSGDVTVTGLNLSVSSTGTDVPVTVKYAGFQNSTTGGSLQASVDPVAVGITYIEATSGNGSVITNSFVASSSNMTLVASKPTVTVSSTQGGTLILGAENKVGEFTVTADANGKISVATATMSLSANGVTNPDFYSYRIADGNTTISSGAVLDTSSSTATIGFAPNYEISAGQSKTFSLYAVVAGTLTSGVTTPYVASSLSASGFQWRDVIGNNTLFAGTNIVNFPTNSYTTAR